MVVLATKVYVEGDRRSNVLASLEALVDDAIGELAVERTVGVRHDGFPTVTVEGPDAAAARAVLGETWGEITPTRGEGDHRGTLESWDEEGIVLDAGEPVRIDRDALGLGPGRPGQIRERFGLVQHLPLWFTREADGEVRLADRERDRLHEWRRGAGRVNVNSATRSEVRATLNRAGHAADYVTVERLGLLEQSVVCAPDTDPPGLLASVGGYLQSELLCVVS